MRRIFETVSDVLETWEGQMTKKKQKQKNKKQKQKQKQKQNKNKKTTDPHKESRTKKEEKVRTMKICKTCVGTTRACNRKKKEFAKYIICGLQ